MSRKSNKCRTVNLQGLIVRLTKKGDAIRVRILEKEPLTDEDRIQLQVLEHQLRYHPR